MKCEYCNKLIKKKDKVAYRNANSYHLHCFKELKKQEEKEKHISNLIKWRKNGCKQNS